MATNETTWAETRRRAIMDVAMRVLCDASASDDAIAGARRELLASAPVDLEALAGYVGAMPVAAFALLRQALDIVRAHREGSPLLND